MPHTKPKASSLSQLRPNVVRRLTVGEFTAANRNEIYRDKIILRETGPKAKTSRGMKENGGDGGWNNAI